MAEVASRLVTVGAMLDRAQDGVEKSDGGGGSKLARRRRAAWGIDPSKLPGKRLPPSK